ncbi:SdpI family protein [Nocardiopsis sp. LOL_012]|uniref:SdpI family protein n=1 Tax=Nocardiopsis sp. LOL_012 TaxID=3345409 RepID=UPI003A864239
MAPLTLPLNAQAEPYGRFPHSDGHLDGAPLVYLAMMLTAVAVYLLYCAYRGWRGALPPNPLFGIRTGYTRSGERAWYAVHRRIAPWLGGSGAVLLLTAAALFPAQFRDGQLVVLPAGAVLAGALAVVGTARATRSARREEGPEEAD